MSVYATERFSKRSRIVKCATLELKPYGATRNTIEELNLLEKDKQRVGIVEKSVKYIDRYIIDMTSKALSAFKFDFAKLIQEYLTSLDDKDVEKLYVKDCEILSNEVTKAVYDAMGIKNAAGLTNAKWLFGKVKDNQDTLPKYLESVGEYEGAELMRSLDGCLALYAQVMSNKETTISKTIAFRVVENMERYADNIALFKRLVEENSEFLKDYEEECMTYSTYDGYEMCLTADQIEAYNAVLSGVNTEEGCLVKGYNGYVNEENIKIKNNNLDIPYYKLAKPLYKAVLVPTAKAFSISSISSNDELKKVIFEDMDIVSAEMANIINTFNNIDINSYVVTNKIHWLSHALFGSHDYITECLNKFIGKKSDYTIKEIEQALNSQLGGTNEKIDICDLLVKHVRLLKDSIDASYNDLDMLGFLACPNIKDDTDCIRGVIRYVDSIKVVSDLLKTFTVKANETIFTNACIKHMDVLKVNAKATNLARNFITKNLKVEVVKTQLCFDMPGKLNASWVNYNADPVIPNDRHTIVKMDNMYYLVTRAPESSTVRFNPPVDKEDTIYMYSVEKAQKASMQMPKLAFIPEVKEFFTNKANNAQSTYVLKKSMNEPVVITREQFEIYSEGSFKTDAISKLGITEEQFRKNCAKIASLYIKIVNNANAFQSYDLSSLRSPEEYQNIGELLDEIDTKTINMSWVAISRSHFDDLVTKKQLLAFLITNKNMYADAPKTSYAELFLSIFSDENMENTNIVLNGSPSIFYRPAILSEKVTHTKGSELVNKKDINGEYIPSFIYQQLYQYYNGRLNKIDLTEDAYRYVRKHLVNHHTATCNISKDARYRREMFTMTFSYTLGKQIAKDTSSLINDDVNTIYDKSGNVLAVSRGVKDLLTYCLLDKEGNVKLSGNLNKIGDIDFKSKLEQVNRDAEKSENWNYDVKVKGIKESYIKFAVAEIAKIAIDNDAIIVIDKISENTREKLSCIDAQIFGTFIEALKNKLSAYIIKEADRNEVGGILNPLNLSYASKGWQAGLVYTMPASNTTSVDIESGFENHFCLRDVKNSTQVKNFFGSFKEIAIRNDELIFSFDYADFVDKKSAKAMDKTEWTIKTDGSLTTLEEDNGKKFYKYYDNIIKVFMDKAAALNDEIDSDDLISSLDNMHPQTVNYLFEIFKSVLFGKKHACGPYDDTMRFSPVTGRILGNASDYSAKMLGLKYMFFNSLDERMSYADKSREWIKSFVNEHGEKYGRNRESIY